ncbi:MAG TPA: PspC domain-containing protein [Bacteroidia bacterium]|jgi:phage shock protein PspC (stress-responsive transcriptional regulator)|nr:PspC domain-containing protein [Bacteroidia bacterium]
MNKTLTINISGIVFNIEEDAYETLKNYLGKIKRHFQNEEGNEEIVADIEGRLAELLKAKMHAGKQVLLMADINDAISVMGQPEDFADNGSEENKKEESHSSSHQNYYANKRRRVFRDPDSKILGGVCSGIGNYFDIDPLWIRLALVVMFFGFGSGFLLYIILWIIIPEAKTTAEKLEMRGEPVDVNTISKTIKDEAENIKNKAKDFGTNVKTQFTNKDNTSKFVDLLRQIFGTIFNIIGKIIGVFFVFFGIVVFVGLLSVLLGFGKVDNLTTHEFINSFAGADFPVFWAKTALALAIGIPFVMLVYKGMKMLLGIKYHNRWINIGAGVLWVVGLILGFCIAVEFGKQFSQDAVLKQQVDAHWPAKDTLYLKANNNYATVETDIDFSMDNNRWYINTQKNVSTWWGRPRVRIITSENDSLYVFMIKSSDGSEKAEAAQRAKNISYQLNQKDSLLLVDKYYSFPGIDKFRNQEIEVLIKLPRNKVIYLDNSMKYLLYDVDNTNEIFDQEMIGKYWKMTENGLTCLNCPRVEITHSKGKNSRVKIDEHGIEVNSSDAHVKIDEEGIKIKSKNKKESKEEE